MNLRYKINARVFIGTELNYYFKHGNTKTDVTTTNNFQGQPSDITSSKTDNTATTILLNVPTAIFLQIKCLVYRAVLPPVSLSPHQTYPIFLQEKK